MPPAFTMPPAPTTPVSSAAQGQPVGAQGGGVPREALEEAINTMIMTRKDLWIGRGTAGIAELQDFMVKSIGTAAYNTASEDALHKLKSDLEQHLAAHPV